MDLKNLIPFWDISRHPRQDTRQRIAGFVFISTDEDSNRIIQGIEEIFPLTDWEHIKKPCINEKFIKNFFRRKSSGDGLIIGGETNSEWDDSGLGESEPQIKNFLAEHSEAYLIGPEASDGPQSYLFQYDGDSTFYQMEQIDELARALGKFDEVKKITDLAMEGKLDFKGALQERLNLLIGVESEILESLFHKLPFTTGMLDMVNFLKKKGHFQGIVSGGFSMVIDKIITAYNLDYGISNELEVHNEKLTGGIVGDIVDSQYKVKVLLEKAEIFNVPHENTVVLGDGSNDIPAMEAANFGIAYRAKPVVMEKARGAILNEDISLVLDLIDMSR